MINGHLHYLNYKIYHIKKILEYVVRTKKDFCDFLRKSPSYLNTFDPDKNLDLWLIESLLMFLGENQFMIGIERLLLENDPDIKEWKSKYDTITLFAEMDEENFDNFYSRLSYEDREKLKSTLSIVGYEIEEHYKLVTH